LLANAVRRQLLDFLAKQVHRSGVQRKHAGDQIERGGFAGAVRSDQGVNLPAVQGQSRILDRLCRLRMGTA
jgi:hypothetical protein